MSKVIVRLNYYEDGSEVRHGNLETFVDNLVNRGIYIAHESDYNTIYVLVVR